MGILEPSTEEFSTFGHANPIPAVAFGELLVQIDFLDTTEVDSRLAAVIDG